MLAGRLNTQRAPGLLRGGPLCSPYARRAVCACRGTSRKRFAAVFAAQSFYDVLGVPQTATDRDIKKAYRQKALKLHPDVNKAPDAEKKFMEVKNAFTVLSDAQQRTEYDRKLRMGTGGWGDFSGWGSTSSTSTSTGARRPTRQEEEFYGLGDLIRDATEGVSKWVQQQDLGKLQDLPGDIAGWVQEQGQKLQKQGVEQFFNDLDKEFESWSKSKKDSGKPMSLWDELAAIGDEFVDFLEDSLGVKEEAGAKGSSTSGSGSSSRPKSPVDEYEELLSKLGMKPGPESSSGSSSSSSSSSSRASGGSPRPPPPPPPPPPRKTADEEVDDMLAALKKKLNKS